MNDFTYWAPPPPDTPDPTPNPTRRRLPALAKIGGLAVGMLVVGVAIGAAGAPAAPAAEPEVVTETTVETVTEVPTGCLDAIAAAGEIADLNADFLTIVNEGTRDDIDTSSFVTDALEAGLDADVPAIERLTSRIEAKTARIVARTDRMDGVNAQMGPAVDRFNVGSAECLAEAAR